MTTATGTKPLGSLWLVFDVESAGLHGEGFAVGWVVARRNLGTIAEGIAVAADALTCAVPDWVAENVMPHLPAPTHPNAEAVRTRFWAVWTEWRQHGALLAADVPWPVEARFLAACVDDDRGRQLEGPYPLIDVASVRLACGMDPLAEVGRWPDETPAHNPLNDARQSARLLLEALR